MKNSKLLDLLKTFDKAELSRFRDFVASPYYNKNEELIVLIEYLELLAPDYPDNKIKKEIIFNKLYPRQSFDSKQMGYLMNYLLKLGEQFLAIKKYEEEERLVNCNILHEFVDRKLDKHYNFLFKKTDQALREPATQDEDHFYYRFTLSKIAAQHFYSQKVRAFDPSLQSVSDNLDDFYFFNKLKYSCEMLNRQAILSDKYRLSFIEELKEYLIKQEEVHPLISIYLRIYLSIFNPKEEQHFTRLMELIEHYANDIEKKARREIYLYAINYCAPKIREGEEKYISIMLDLYTKGIDNKSLFDGPYLSHWTYSNVVKLALRLERYEWIEEFIHKNSSNLNPKYREDAQHYNMADVFYHRKEFDQVLSHLSQLHFSDLHYLLGARVMMVKTYYEIDEIEPLLSQLASFSVYLRRNKKISLPLKKTCLNFCSLLHQILRNNPKKREELREEISNTQPLTERNWLLKAWENRTF